MTAKLFKNEARRIHEAIRFHGIDARHWQVMKKKNENIIQFVMFAIILFVCFSIKFNCSISGNVNFSLNLI